MDEARKLALELALQARTSAEDDVVAIAEKFLAFLKGGEVIARFDIDDALAQIRDDVSKAREPEGYAKSDQTPPTYSIDAFKDERGAVKWIKPDNCRMVEVAITGTSDPEPFDDSVPTRLVRQTGGE
jgi:hypothetical protein